ncbi:MAG: methyltransferase domain-containing protein [Candidatus Freyarchaeota archaeon]|nr:methyltransferase domain-containing protein [Candidatus Jordarchaeia archaeon]
MGDGSKGKDEGHHTNGNSSSGEKSKHSKNNNHRGNNHRNRVRTLGPVSSLEEYVPQDWWRRIFNSLYLKTDGDVIDDQEVTRYEVDLFSSILKLKPDDRILDLCCGQGRHSLELARRGYRFVEGLDRSHYLINKAKERARREGLNVRFKVGDARRLPYPPDTFDVVLILGNSFGYFETVYDDLRVLKEVFRVLKPWGRILIDVADGEYLREHFQPRSWEWIDKKHFVVRERSLSVDRQRLISREIITHTEKGVIADHFYAERLYTKESLKDLLQQAGLSNVTIHGDLATHSKRNQDLGMMEKRIVVTAVAKKEWTPIKRREKEGLLTVAVILGDPTKCDALKPGGVFDEDDIYTIDALKDALRQLKDYNFIYLNNHDTLLQDLIKLKPKIDYVFNLCDEGFNNDPRKELHIPALLEMLNIPYTGSGPQPLAHCYDKSLIRGLAKEMGIPVPEAVLIKPEDESVEIHFGFPAIVKPNFGDSSFGITHRSVVNNSEELLNAISEIRERFGYNRPILVEEFLTGKDLTVGIIGNVPDAYTVLPITEEDYSNLPEGLPPICGYEAKWLPDSPYWNIKSKPADLPLETETFIVRACLSLFERLEIRDYCRFDWRLDASGRPKLLEVNPNPGWCWDGHLAKMAKFAGMSYAEMLEAILKAAEQRLGIRPKYEKYEKLSDTTRAEAQAT